MVTAVREEVLSRGDLTLDGAPIMMIWEVYRRPGVSLLQGWAACNLVFGSLVVFGRAGGSLAMATAFTGAAMGVAGVCLFAIHDMVGVKRQVCACCLFSGSCVFVLARVNSVTVDSAGAMSPAVLLCERTLFLAALVVIVAGSVAPHPKSIDWKLGVLLVSVASILLVYWVTSFFRFSGLDRLSTTYRIWLDVIELARFPAFGFVQVALIVWLSSLRKQCNGHILDRKTGQVRF